MKARYFILAVACFVATAVRAQKELVVLSTNDTHSTIMPLSNHLNDTLKAGRGGFVRRVALIEEQRRLHPDLLLFDSGDFSQGSAYYTTFKGEVEVKLMNRMKYDAVALGNHEFDFGAENLSRLIDMSEFPWVCANYDFTGTVLEGKVEPYVILERDGVSVGVFGLSPRLEGLVAQENIGGVVYKDPIACADSIVGWLRNALGCDVVICLSHLGWDMKSVVDDSTVVANTAGIDLVLGAHSHSYFTNLQYVKNAEGKDVPVEQNGKHGIFVGKQTLTIRSKE